MRGNERGNPPPPDDDPVPADPDEFRLELARRVMTFLGAPRSCRQPVCRRAQRCADIGIACLRDLPPLRLTPEQQARAIARVQQALRQHIAAVEQEEQP